MPKKPSARKSAKKSTPPPSQPQAPRFQITPRNPTQHEYLTAIRSSDVTFGLGPAGTGKTFLAVAAAIEALQSHKVHKIILVRPAVEAGERLGFLPGSLQEKVDPYLRPLYDALHEMLSPERVKSLMEEQTIEVAPLAFMRGRTLKHAFVIMDEAQNTTSEQMKMFLTRLGSGSKMVVNGDLTQIDLPIPARSGLTEALRVLRHTEGVAVTEFTEQDVVRHRMVQRMVKAYELAARQKE